MKTKVLTILGVLIIAAVAVNAFGPNYENMRDIIEQGTFNDLQAYREESGRQMKPWVENQADFNEMQQYHEQMIEEGYGPENCPYAEEDGCPFAEQGRQGFDGKGQGMHGYGREGGCPYMQ